MAWREIALLRKYVITLLLLLSIVACTQQRADDSAEQSPFVAQADGAAPHFDLPEIEEGGELILLTTYGPGTFFEFRGEHFGLQYMIACEYAKSIGTSVRVEVATSVQDMLRKLLCGEGDMIACAVSLPDSVSGQLSPVGGDAITSFLDSLSRSQGDASLKPSARAAWVVRDDSPLLMASLSEWMDRHGRDFYDYTTIRVKQAGGRTYAPRRKVSAPILNASRRQISVHDAIITRYAATCRWDWRLLAAQAYQESAFDEKAVSCMGAMGLMQLMPGTARDMGVEEDEIFEAESNMRGAVKYISWLNTHYSSIASDDERINFVLAAYNAGPGHVDDARALALKYGKNPDRWLGNVDVFVLKMSEAQYYNQPEVKHGYFRGSETYGYVNAIRARWEEYRRKVR